MKTLRALLVFTLNFLWFSSAYSQSSIGVSPFTTGYLPDTVYIGVNFQANVTLQNHAVNPFTGNLYIEFAVDSTGTGNGVLQPIYTDSIKAFPCSIGALDTLNLTNFSIPVSAGNFRTGVNTVVIWPRFQAPTGGNTIHDSLRKNVYAVDPLSVWKKDIYNSIKIKQIGDFIQIITDNKTLIEQVRFIELSGNSITWAKYQLSGYLEHFKPGVYFLQITTSSGKTIMLKWLKTP